MPTVSLRRFDPPPLALEIRPLARIAGRALQPLAPSFFPPEGPCLLVVWRPGPAEPAFELVRESLRRDGSRWRLEREHEEGWVVLHERSIDP